MSLGSQQGNRHVHWHVAPLPPGVPYEYQQLAAFSWGRGVLDLPEHELAALAQRIGRQIERMRQSEARAPTCPDVPRRALTIGRQRHPRSTTVCGCPVRPAATARPRRPRVLPRLAVDGEVTSQATDNGRGHVV
jgi:hypothetical protein